GDIVEVRARNDHENVEVADTSDPFTRLGMDTTGWVPGSHTIIVQAKDSPGAFSYPRTFTVYVQDAAGPTFAEQLVANIIDGTSVAASNETYDGEQEATGVFDNGLVSGLQMDEGILISTGMFSSWNGGNVSRRPGMVMGSSRRRPAPGPAL